MISRTTLIFALFGVIFFMVFGPAPADAELFMNVSGKAAETTSGANLPGVKIVLMSQTRGKIAETLTDAKGNFLLRRVAKGAYDLIAISEDKFLISSKEPIPIVVHSGKNVVGIFPKLQRGGAISGKIVTSKGHVLPHTTIMSDRGISTVSDSMGNFLLKGITPGPSKLAIIAPAIGIKTGSVLCEEGKITEMGNIVLPIGVETTIYGTVVDTTGNPISGVTLVAYNTSTATGGYAVSAETGAFIITGLDPGKYELYAVSYGYEQKKVSNIDIPSGHLNIVLTTSPTQTSSVVTYRVVVEKRNEKTSLMSMLLDLVTPAEAIAQSDGYCPDGNWIGYGVDITALVPIWVLHSGGGSMTVGRYHCMSSSPRLDFTSWCAYVGVSTIVSSIGFGGDLILCERACLSEHLLGESNGFIATFAAPVGLSGYGGSYDYQSGNSARCVAFGAGLGVSTNLFKLLASSSNLWGAFIGYKHCDTVKAVNIFEWWDEFFSNL